MNTISKQNMISKIAATAMVLTLAITGCTKDNTADPVIPIDALKTTYNFYVKDILGVTGTITFAELTSGSSQSIITISLTGAPSGIHPTYIFMHSAVETGGVAYTLSSVDTSGKSNTVLNVPYSTLINYDGYVNVLSDQFNMGTIIAQCDIGGNALTSTNKTYTLNQDSTSGISGTAKFDKRVNGNTLVTINITSVGVLPPGLYPAHINLGSVATIGLPELRKTLNTVDGSTRKSITNVRTLNDGSVINYDNWMVYDGFITIHNATDSTDIICLGNIGSN